MASLVIPLFSTADIPIETINSFLHTAATATSEGSSTAFQLIPDPSHTDIAQHHPGTKPPIQPFTSGFTNKPPSSLGDFLSTHIPQANPGGVITRTPFVTLDERSTRDETVAVVDWEVSFSKEQQEEGLVDDLDQAAKRGWRVTRVSFKGTASLVVGLSFKPQLYEQLFTEEKWYNDGVFLVPGVDRDW